MISKNKLKQDIDERSAKNTNVPKGTIIESKIYPSEFSGNRSNIAKTVTSVKKAIPSSNPRQQVDYYLNELSNYIDWATSSSPDPLKNKNSFFPSVKRTITFQAAKPKEKDTQQGGFLADRDFQDAIKNGNIEAVQRDITDGVDVNSVLPYNTFPLHYAITNGKLEIVKLLLANGADKNKRDHIGAYRPIHWAVSNKQIKIAELLIEKKVNLNKTTDSGDSPLDLAALNGDLDMVKLLVENGANIEKKYLGDVDHSRSDRHMPLHKASKKGHLEVVKYLIDNKAIVHNANHNEKYNSPLHEAANGGHLEVVKYLIDNGANINALNDNGDKPINTVRLTGNVNDESHKIALFLMRKGLEDGSFKKEDATDRLKGIFQRIQEQDTAKEVFGKMSKTSGTELGQEVSSFLGGKKNKRTQKRKKNKDNKSRKSSHSNKNKSSKRK